jgi:hypothetical protein
MFETSTKSPQSDNRTNLLFVSGATRSSPTSLKKVCDNPFNLTLISVTVPVNPETVMFEGYGVALPANSVPTGSLIIIRSGLVNVVCAKAATVKTAKIKTKLLKKDKIFIFLLEKLKAKSVSVLKVFAKFNNIVS